jgi:VanZ family protein
VARSCGATSRASAQSLPEVPRGTAPPSPSRQAALIRIPQISPVAFRIALAIALVAILHLATTERSYAVAEDLNDKVSHVLAFGVLAFLAEFSFPHQRSRAAVVILLLAFGVLIEAIQYFIPYRDASLLDLAADALGIAVYFWPVRAFMHRALPRSLL